jgi:hypothetical protein
MDCRSLAPASHRIYSGGIRVTLLVSGGESFSEFELRRDGDGHLQKSIPGKHAALKPTR